MKKMTMAGGLGGFGLGLLCGLVTEGSSWPTILLRASIAALAAACLLRWWMRMVVGCLAQARAERVAAPAETRAPATGSRFVSNVL